MSTPSPRRRAREFALQGVYQWLLSGNSAAVIEDFLARETASFETDANFRQADRELFLSLLRSTLDQADALESEFAPLIDRAVSELSPVERAVLMIATHELKNHLEIPYRVVINEAIELTKTFGGAEGHRFVNGVLDKLALRLREPEVEASRAQGKKRNG